MQSAPDVRIQIIVDARGVTHGERLRNRLDVAAGGLDVDGVGQFRNRISQQNVPFEFVLKLVKVVF